MPTYHYVCSKCGHEFEAFQSISAAPLRVCRKESCPQTPWGKGTVKRAITAGAGLIFKGSGFYVTDYRSEGYRAAAKKETEAAAPKKEASTSCQTGQTQGKAAPKKESKTAAAKT